MTEHETLCDIIATDRSLYCCCYRFVSTGCAICSDAARVWGTGGRDRWDLGGRDGCDQLHMWAVFMFHLYFINSRDIQSLGLCWDQLQVTTHGLTVEPCVVDGSCSRISVFCMGWIWCKYVTYVNVYSAYHAGIVALMLYVYLFIYVIINLF